MNSIDRVARPATADSEAPASCLNCEAPLTGPYCAECGQRGRINRTLRSFLADFVSGMVNLEGRLWHTLPLLVWRPGELTRRYVDGQRARFVSPVGLYLFTVFLMFAVLGFTGALDNFKIDDQVGSKIDAKIQTEQAALTKLEQDRASAVAAKKDVTALNEAIASRREDITQLQRVKDGDLPFNDDPKSQNPAWIKQAIQSFAKNPRETSTKIQEAASKYSWLLIPLSVPVLRLLFPFRRRRLYDHTVFVTYSLSFMMFLVIAAGLLVMIGQTVVAGLLLLVPPVHMYRQLRGAYGLRWWDALLRTFILVNAAGLVLLLWTLAIAALGILE